MNAAVPPNSNPVRDLLACGSKRKVSLLNRSSENLLKGNLLKGMGETLNVASEASFEANPSE
jgi:hypothetical protein